VGVKYLKRDSDDVVEQAHSAEPWATPDGWVGLVGVTHSEVDPPGGEIKYTPELYDGFALAWKIVADAWVARSDTDKDPEKLANGRDARLAHMSRCQQEIDALTTLEGSSNPDVAAAATAAKVDPTACISSHEAEWDNVWVPGTNP
jgi:hypothetical protein